MNLSKIKIMKPKNQFIILLIFLLVNTYNGNAQNPNLSVIPPLRNFQFQIESSSLIKGISKETDPSSSIISEEIVGNLSLVTLKNNNYCFTDGRYNHTNYQVEKGIISDDKGTLQLETYNIFEPKVKATDFLASSNCIYFKFPTQEDYIVYLFINHNFEKIKEIPASQIILGDFTPIKDLIVNHIKGSQMYVFVPKKTKISIFNSMAKNVEGALINDNAISKIYQINYPINAEPFDFSDIYNPISRHYFFIKLNNNKIGLIWQDNIQKSIWLSIFESNFLTKTDVKLPNSNQGNLVAVTGSNIGKLFYVTIKDADNLPVNAVLSKINLNGTDLVTSQLDVSQKELNMFAQQGYPATLEYSNNNLMMLIGRKMHKSGDGLNHQGGIAVKYDATTLQQIRNYGQTSGHSFDNYLTTNKKGEFVGIDLGDNYPRGINLHTFDENLHSKVVYSFKTEHGTTADCWGIKTFPLYPEISTAEKKYYKWSNDNNTYTNLGAVSDVGDGYLVTFLGEPDANGKALNNSQAGLPCPMNVGFVKVNYQFYLNENSNQDIFLSKGISETGGFFTFGGWWSELKNNGLVWLTRYIDKENETAANLKVVMLENGHILLLWEIWSKSKYQKTVALKLDKDGKKLSAIIDMGNLIRLSRRDDLISIGNTIYLTSGSKNSRELKLFLIELKP